MKDREQFYNELISILLLIITLLFTSSNITPESLQDSSWAEISPIAQGVI